MQYIAILEDNAERQAEMSRLLSGLLPPFAPAFFVDAASMVEWLREHQGEVRLISLDHDLPVKRLADGSVFDAGTGQQVASFLASMPVTCPVIVHTSNAPAGQSMMEALRDAGWPVARVFPHDDVAWIGDDWMKSVNDYIRQGFIVS